jgi:hypothetical protein
VDGDDETSVDAVDVGEPVHRHQEEVEVVDGGTLDDPVDPARKVIRSDHFRFLSETPRQFFNGPNPIQLFWSKFN